MLKSERFSELSVNFETGWPDPEGPGWPEGATKGARRELIISQVMPSG